uniref:Uncharacterized protein n=1 Tax=Timema monikensis TaxID=170555 RepID=A0A7R9DZY3_9NEOP|nr:unnamed protein product [Timema monikensis]
MRLTSYSACPPMRNPETTHHATRTRDAPAGVIPSYSRGALGTDTTPARSRELSRKPPTDLNPLLLSTPDRDSNPELSVTGSLVYCESDTIDHAATKAGVKQPVSGGSASVGNMRDGSLLVGLLSVKSCKAIRFHLLVVVMVLLSRFLIRVEGLPWPIDAGSKNLTLRWFCFEMLFSNGWFVVNVDVRVEGKGQMPPPPPIPNPGCVEECVNTVLLTNGIHSVRGGPDARRHYRVVQVGVLYSVPTLFNSLSPASLDGVALTRRLVQLGHDQLLATNPTGHSRGTWGHWIEWAVASYSNYKLKPRHEGTRSTSRGLRVAMPTPALGRRRTASCLRTAVFLFLVTFVWLQLHVANLSSGRQRPWE